MEPTMPQYYFQYGVAGLSVIMAMMLITLARELVSFLRNRGGNGSGKIAIEKQLMELATDMITSVDNNTNAFSKLEILLTNSNNNTLSCLHDVQSISIRILEHTIREDQNWELIFKETGELKENWKKLFGSGVLLTRQKGSV